LQGNASSLTLLGINLFCDRRASVINHPTENNEYRCHIESLTLDIIYFLTKKNKANLFLHFSV
jgi:hypothetical protein